VSRLAGAEELAAVATGSSAGRRPGFADVLAGQHPGLNTRNPGEPRLGLCRHGIRSALAAAASFVLILISAVLRS